MDSDIRWSIAGRLSLIVVVFLLLSMFFITTFYYNTIRDSLYIDMQLRARSVLKSLSISIEEALPDENINLIQTLVESSALIVGVERVSFIDAFGKVVADSSIEKIEKEVDKYLLKELIDRGSFYEDFRTARHGNTFYVLKILRKPEAKTNEDIVGVIIIGMNLRRIELSLINYLKKIIDFS